MQDIIEKFVSPSGKPVRVVVRDGDTWFVAKDVAKELGYINTAQMTRWLDDDEFIKLDARNLELHADCACNSKELPLPTQTGGNSGTPMMVFISESGLYHAALRSRMPKAKAFRRWVTHEVLPSLRKRGAYIAPEMVKALREERDKAVREKSWISSSREAKAMAELSKLYGIVRLLKLRLDDATRKNDSLEMENNELKMKVADLERKLDDATRKLDDLERKIEELLPDAEAYRRWLKAWKDGMNRWHEGMVDPGQGRLWDDDRELLEEAKQ